MKHVKKLLALILALAIVTAALPMAVFAGAQHKITVTLRIEGVSQNYYYETLTVQYSSTNFTVQDLIIYADNNSDAITVVGAAGNNPYITDINGDVAGSLGAYSGWLYTVNGVEPPVGVNGYNLSEGDSVIFYFGDPYGVGMQYPVADTSDIANGVIAFTSTDTTYDEQWNPVVSVNPVAGMTVIFGGETPATYVTDKDGKITIDEQYLTPGEHSLSIDKKGDKGVPLVLRLAPDFTVTVPEKPKTLTAKLRIEGINANLFYDDVTVTYTGDQLSVQDFIIYTDENSGELTVIGAEGDSPYITSINGDTAATFGGWDGWLFEVNGVEAATGVNGVFLNDGDEVLFYYGDPYGVGMQYPVADTSDIANGVIAFTSTDTTYDEQWNPVVTANPVIGMTVVIGEATFTTDDEGKIYFDNEILPAGKYALSIDKKDGNGLPLVLRFAPDAEIDIPELPVATSEMTVKLRIEGINANLFYDDVTVTYTGDQLSVQDFIIYADENSGELTVIGAEGDSPYITSINGDVAATFGGWDGWLFEVNGVEAATGVNGVFLNDGDEVLFYYGDPYGVGMQYPEVDLTDIDKHVVRFVSNDTTYDEQWNPVVTANPVIGMTVLFDGQEFVTNDNGEIKLGRDLLTAGAHTVATDKKAENGLPLVLRFAPDFTVELPEVNDIPGDMDFDREITVADALAVLRIAAKLVPVTDEALAICDMDNDGQITVADALYVLRVAAKLIPAPGGDQPGGNSSGTGNVTGEIITVEK